MAECMLRDGHLHPDHPHTDPGDKRTECPTCHKWVLAILHSCKGVDVRTYCPGCHDESPAQPEG